MFRFIIKFIRSMQKEQKALLLFIIISMIVCNILVINVINQYMYDDDLVEYIHTDDRIVTLSYTDGSDIDKIITDLSSNENVSKSSLSGYALVDNVPKMVIAKSEGKDYESQPLLFGQHFEGKDGAIQIYINEEFKNSYNLLEDNIVIRIGDLELACTGGILLSGSDYEVSYNDFISLLNSGYIIDGSCSVIYQYIEEFSKQDIEKLNSQLSSIKRPSDIFYTMNEYDVDLSNFIESANTIILGLVVAIINYMFIYLFLIRNRIKNYNILKLLGFGNLKILLVMLSEMLILFIASFALGMAGYITYLKLINGYDTYIMSIFKYSFVLMLILNIAIYIIAVRKMIKQSPFEFYKQVD